MALDPVLRIVMQSQLRVDRILAAVQSWELARDILRAAEGHVEPFSEGPELKELMGKLDRERHPLLYLDAVPDVAGGAARFGDLLEAYLFERCGRHPEEGHPIEQARALRYAATRRAELADLNEELLAFAVHTIETACGRGRRI